MVQVLLGTVEGLLDPLIAANDLSRGPCTRPSSQCCPLGVKVNLWPARVTAYMRPPLAMVNTSIPF